LSEIMPLSPASTDVVKPTAYAQRTWCVALIACALAVGLQSGFAALSDPDLPSHLAIGEWIVAHHSVPYVEPFAWTRAGAPFFAYSWLSQATYFLLLQAAGPVALHILSGLMGVAITVSGAVAAKALGARGPAPTLFGVASAIVAFDTTPFLRPQLAMFVLVPLAWACIARLREHNYQSPGLLATLVILNAIAAGTHISFPVMAVPLVLIPLGADRTSLPKSSLVVLATCVGWLLSPYATDWIEVFRLNFAPNAITHPPAPTGELTPGFVVSPLIGGVIAALPLVALAQPARARERMAFGALWLVGLVVFARMYKGLGPWWWCATPIAVTALQQLPRASSKVVRGVYACLLVAFVAALSIPNVRLYPQLARLEGGVVHRSLPSLKGFAAEPAARWLESHVRPGSRGRVVTAFNYGSYLQWRLPTFSESIDGRTIFPDSAAMPDAIGERGVAYEGPWRSADVAVLPTTYPSAARLSADGEWIYVGIAERAPWAPMAPQAGLWVRRVWWERYITPEMAPPSRPLVLREDRIILDSGEAR
jgi:hypothetical protein